MSGGGSSVEKRLRFGDLVLRLMEHEVHCRGVTKYIDDKLILQSERMLFLRPMFNGLLSVSFSSLSKYVSGTTKHRFYHDAKAKMLPYRSRVLEY